MGRNRRTSPINGFFAAVKRQDRLDLMRRIALACQGGCPLGLKIIKMLDGVKRQDRTGLRDLELR